MLHNTNRKPSNQPKYNEVTALEILRHIDIAAVLKNPILFVILIHLVSLYTVRSSSATSTNIIEEPQSPSWLNTYSLKAGLGYNDNITFSSVERDNSPFIIGGVDAMFYRIPKDDYSFYAFILGEGKYYTDAESVEMEKFIISQAELEKEFSDKYRLGTRIGHIYQDRIFDASITEDIYSTLQVQGHDFSVSPFIEYDFTSRLTGGFKLQLERQLFDEPLDDYWEYRPAFSLEFSRSKHSGLEFTYKPGYRTYDTRFS
ncbi:MAG: hypothetical protein K9N52_06125, partial [Verrucomicrobia bacterium]|nr:hypothetical protein [Verrucomicrobiota bacterium]